VSRVEEIERAIDALNADEFRRVAEHVNALERLRNDLQLGLDALDRGEYEAHDADSTGTLASEIKSRGRESVGQSKKSQP
jgi:hypothetical protein